MKDRYDVLMVVFFAAWLLCGCSVEKVFEDWRSAVCEVIALLVMCTCAAVLGGWGHDL